MDVKQYMIVDLDRQGDKRMFVTEQVKAFVRTKTDFGLSSFHHPLVYSITIGIVYFFLPSRTR